MKAISIQSVIHKKSEKMGKYLFHIPIDFLPEDIHDFRVEYKKLRAFIHLLQEEDDACFHPKLMAELKEIYRATGRLRNWQLQKAYLAQVSEQLGVVIPETYINMKRFQMEKEKRFLKVATRSFSMKQQEEKLLRVIPTSLKSETIKSFIQKEQEYMLQLWEAKHFYDEGLHEIRKLLKDFLYNWPYITPYVLFSFPGYLSDIDYLGSLALTLGEFHDQCIFLSLLKVKYTKAITLPEDQVVMNKIFLETRKRKMEMKDAITLDLRYKLKELQKECLLMNDFELN